MTRFLTITFSILTILAGLGGCEERVKKGTLYVYCDVLLQPAAEKIAAKFESESDYKVQLWFDPEDRLFQRMKLSSHADLYISITPDLIERTKQFDLGKEPVPICYIVPAFITKSLNPLGIDSVADFKLADFRFGFCDEDTLLGKTTKQLFEKNDLGWEEVYQAVHLPSQDEAALITGIQDGALDVGIVWDVTAMKTERVNRVAIPKKENARLPVVAIPLVKSEHPEAVTKLVEFMKSPEAQTIWEESGLEKHED